MATPALTRITEQDADQEGERLFAPIPAAAFPKRSYAISVMSPAGFPITITLNDIRLDKLDESLAALLERGYMPAETPSVLTSPNAPAAHVSAPGQPPVCQFHGPMKESTARPGTWFCPKKMGDGSYCKEKG